MSAVKPTAEECANLKALVHELEKVAFAQRQEGQRHNPDYLDDFRARLSREIERMESETLERARTAETPETGTLKACPFCGSPARWFQKPDFEDFVIECSGNPSCVITTAYATEQEALAAWNKRASKTTSGKSWEELRRESEEELKKQIQEYDGIHPCYD